MTALRDFLTRPWLTTRVQIALGVIFIVAALPKIGDAPSFAHMVYNYRIVPGPLVNLLALFLPWFELLVGLGLVLGIWKRTATAWIGVMLLGYILGISLNLARGNAIDCGCFDPTAANKTRDERIADMKFVLFRDIGMLLMVWQSFEGMRRLEESGEASPFDAGVRVEE